MRPAREGPDKLVSASAAAHFVMRPAGRDRIRTTVERPEQPLGASMRPAREGPDKPKHGELMMIPSDGPGGLLVPLLPAPKRASMRPGAKRRDHPHAPPAAGTVARKGE